MRSMIKTDYDIAMAFLEDTVIPYLEDANAPELDERAFKALVVGYLSGARYRRMRLPKLESAAKTVRLALERSERRDSEEYRTCARVSELIERLASSLPGEIHNPNEGRRSFDTAAVS